jgi:integration host factor subunit beta
MTKSELIEKLASDFPHVQVKDVESSVKEILEQMAGSLAANERI